MTASILSGSFSVRASSLTFTFAHPTLILGDGEALALSESHAPVIDDQGDTISIDYHWQTVAGRLFEGNGLVAPCGSGFCWTLKVRPVDGGSWSLQSTTEGSCEVSGWNDSQALQLFHADNVRGVTQGVFLTEGRYFLPISDWQQPLNIGRWQSFPGLWLSAPNEAESLIYGVLSQAVWKHSLKGSATRADAVSLDGRMFAPGIPAKSFAAGEAYHGEEIYFEVVKKRNPSQAFAGYLDALARRLHPAKTSSHLINHAFWDSWNDRQPYFWDVSMDLIQRTISTLRKHFASVKSLEVDDGYAFAGFQEVRADIWTQFEHGVAPSDEVQTIKKVRRLGVAFAHEDDYATARDRFPDGVGAAASAMKAEGFLPAVWLGLNIVRDAKLVLDRPKWTADCVPRDGDDKELANIFTGSSTNRLQVLDPSIPEVREYYRKVFEVLFREWKFEALKLDFWTYAFENDSFRLKNTALTALELRNWLFSTIREYLPEPSYLIACCDISTGNPFFSSWVDTIRYGIDIGNGRWDNIRYSALTGTFLLHVEAWRFYLLNPDSVGVLKNLPESEKRCFVSWCAATRSLCEIAGDLAFASSAEIRPLQKMLLAPKNGRAIRFGEFEHLSRNEPAAIVYSTGDLFSQKGSIHLPDGLLAIFNWSDETRFLDVDVVALGLDDKATWIDADFHSEAQPLMRSGTWSVELPPRSVRLSHLTKADADQPAIIDSNWMVREAGITKDDFQLSLNGNAPEGFLLYWPFGLPPVVQSSNLKVTVTEGSEKIYRLLPELNPDSAILDWNVLLAV